jgi:hypothetical protein
VVADKGKQEPSLERNQPLVYSGPFRKVEDDDGQLFQRGERIAVCDQTYHLQQEAPYDGMYDPIDPREKIPHEQALPFDCRRSKKRDTRETKGQDYHVTAESLGPCCGVEGTCC